MREYHQHRGSLVMKSITIGKWDLLRANYLHVDQTRISIIMVCIDCRRMKDDYVLDHGEGRGTFIHVQIGFAHP